MTQTRPYDGKSGRRVWLSRSEQDRLVDQFAESPRKALALRLGLCGLRADEIPRVAREHVRQIDAEREAYKLVIPTAKRGKRETPLPEETKTLLVTTANARGLAKDEPVIDRVTKTVQRWASTAAEQLDDAEPAKAWNHVTFHDLRRTWATDTFYTLAFHGVPIAEELTMGWGGWAMSESGRRTFRENYLGPEPDHIAHQAMEKAALL
ncbi:site-specific integrase [Halobaculum lipolyticum]|uniref:Site-specific integrase n=1 Tax=Halobaculum lipolyticum TaxID=3032001 RepID=A0ABD5W905_9EURY|nr:site-specific integrase [Halobaculum sp. DT31]